MNVMALAVRPVAGPEEPPYVNPMALACPKYARRRKAEKRLPHIAMYVEIANLQREWRKQELSARYSLERARRANRANR
jgi:hypothetical protein